MAAGAKMEASGTSTALTGHSTAQVQGEYQVQNMLIMPMCPLCAVCWVRGCLQTAGRHAATASVGAAVIR